MTGKPEPQKSCKTCVHKDLPGGGVPPGGGQRLLHLGAGVRRYQ